MTTKTPDLGFEPKGLFIGGDWVKASSGKSITTINPSNGDVLGEVPLASVEDVDLAVAAAKEAFPAWAGLEITKRAQYLIRLADAIDVPDALEQRKLVRDFADLRLGDVGNFIFRSNDKLGI